MRSLQTALEANLLDDSIDPDTVYSDPHSDEARDYERELRALLEDLRDRVDSRDEAADSALHKQAQSLLDGTLKDVDDAGLLDALAAVVK